jgi:hypothetical protein
MRAEAGKRHRGASAGTVGRVPQPKKPYKLAGFKLHPEQIKALRREARRRAEERDASLSDASELVREAIDAWLSSHVKGYKPPKS